MKGNIVRYLNEYIPDYYYSKVTNITDYESTHHYHHAFEIYYMKDGMCNYFIGEHSYKVMPGDVILIPADTIHKTNYGGVAHSRCLINCSDEYIPGSALEQIPSTGYLYHNNKIIKRLEEIFVEIEAEYSNMDELSEEALKCYTTELFILILRNKNEYENKREESNLVTQVLKYVQNNYMNNVKLSSVAKIVSVSPEHLSRVFKQEIGFGFKEYLTIIRLQKAEDMLKKEPGRTICEVAYACGFNDGNYFSYKFKEAYGVSPSKMREQSETKG